MRRIGKNSGLEIYNHLFQFGKCWQSSVQIHSHFFFTEKLETETTAKQTNLETLRREKVELENTLEQEQEALVNKLWKRMDQLETGNFIQINKFIKSVQDLP